MADDKPDDKSPIVKQPANAATWSRTTTIGIGVPAVTTAAAAIIVYGFQVIRYFSPGFPIIDDPVVISSLASVIAGGAAAAASWIQRGTTIHMEN